MTDAIHEALALELDTFAASETLTQDDVETIEGYAAREGWLGYIGHFWRNYLTDEWLLQVANDLHWSRSKLIEWTCGVEGRWAIEDCPRSVDEMRAVMVADYGLPA